MKTSDLFFLASVAYIAPHVGERLARALALGCFVTQLYFMWRGD